MEVRSSYLLLFLLFLVIETSGHLKDEDQVWMYSRRKMVNYLLDPKKYDARIPPDYESDDATRVSLQVYLLSIDAIDEASMDYSLTIYLRQKWVDKRLRFPGYNQTDRLELDTKRIKNVWVPDTFFRNEIKSSFHTVTVPNRLIHIYKNGTVVYSLKLSLKLVCQMNLYKYPFDSQRCPLIIQSYAYTTDNVIFEWTKINPISITPELELPQFYIDGYFTQPCTASIEGEFACIQAKFELRRATGYLIAQVYIPSSLIVVLSWVPFWHDDNGGRISINVLIVLTMTTLSSGAQSSLPKVSHVKAIDVWMAMCTIFVFASLLESAVVNYISGKDYYDNISRKMDYVVRFALPLTFLVANAIYWCLFLL